MNSYDLDAHYSLNGSLQTGYHQKNYKIATISWEKARTWGVGIDATLFGKMTVGLDYYDRKTTGIIMDVPVPAGVYGLFILLGGLCTKVISLSDVEVTGNLLLDLMPVMFIPAAVGIIDKIEELKVIMIPMLIITFVTTFIVMTITGKTAEWIIKRQKKREK